MRQHNKSSLFLMELIIAILFFGLASALCIQMFVSAKVMNETSYLESQAAMKASSIAETYRAQQREEFYQPDFEGYIYFDRDWNQTTSKDAHLKANLQVEKDTLTITIYNEEKVLFTLESVHYQQREVKE